MARSLTQMTRDLHAYWHEIETEVVDVGHSELARIYQRADRRMYELRDLFYGLSADGTLAASPEALVKAGEVLDEFQLAIEVWYVEEGKAWSKAQMPALLKAGRKMVQLNLFDVVGVDQELLAETLRHVSVAEKGILRVGLDDQYRIMGTMGDDIGAWFRRTLMDSMVEGLPVQAPLGQDSLFNRLYESGRLKPVTIRTAEGKLITRSVKQRAQAIARIEPAKIINRLHHLKGEEALGGQALWKDAGPIDSDTTQICIGAYGQAPMTRTEWAASQWGLPPRLRQFHLCRHFLIAVLPEWEDEEVVRAREKAVKKVKDLGELEKAA